MACSLLYPVSQLSRASICRFKTYPDAKKRLLSNIKHIRQSCFLSEPTQQLFLVTCFKVKLDVTSHIMQFIHEGRALTNKKRRAVHTWNILNISSWLRTNALRHVNDTGKHFFACIWVMSLDKKSKNKNTGFLRFRLPVLLQQNLRCKVWGDTAKIRYIALFAISEQCSQKLFWPLKMNSLSQQCSVRKWHNQYWTSEKHFHYHSTCSYRTFKKPKHATLEWQQFSKQHVAVNWILKKHDGLNSTMALCRSDMQKPHIDILKSVPTGIITPLRNPPGTEMLPTQTA